MDRHTWMYKISRVAREYIDGVETFIEFAEEFLKKKRMELGKEEMIMCPCRDCYNLKKYPSAMTVRDHLFRRGFYVMKYMHDIVMLSQKNPDVNWKVGLGSRSYTKKEINEIRELWAKFFTLECL